MKRILKRWCSLLLAGLLLLAAAPAGALAQEGEASPEMGVVYQWGDGETGVALRETQDSLEGGDSAWNQQETFSAPLGSYDDGSLYGQLTQRQKDCYNALAGIPLSQILTAAEVNGFRQVKVRVDSLYGLTMTGSISGGTFAPDASSQALYREIYTDLCAAITALRYDRPDALWLSNMRYGIFWESSNGTSVTTRLVTFAFQLRYNGLEQQMYTQQMASAQAIANQVNRSAGLYQQVKQIHDLLAAQSTYCYVPADSKAQALSHQAYSCLVAGDAYEPVCDGYAKAMKVVCDLLDIPCVLVASKTHMWNNIKMDDGDWYNLDLTWDDMDDSRISHDYFLVGSRTVVDGAVFSQQKEHVEKNPWVNSNDLNQVTFQYPVKNQQAYEVVPGGYEPLRFPDVKRSSWYYDYVESAAGMGLFTGDEKGFFNPGNKITRAEFVQVLYNTVAPDYTLTQSQFRDVAQTAWYAEAVNWAAELGVVTGKGNGLFAPDASITREEMCVIVNNYITKVLQVTPEYDGYVFADDASISDWAKKGVYHAYAFGLISGKENDQFDPQGNTLRSEAAVVFVKSAALLEELGDPAA